MKLLKTSVVLTLVALICGALIGVTQFVTGPIIKENSSRRAYEVYLEYFEDLVDVEEKEVDGKYVYEVLEVLDGNNKIIGYLFKGKDTNSFGLIDIVVAVDKDGALIGAKILQTENTNGIYTLHVNDDNSLKAIKGNSVSNFEGVEDQAGASVTGGSLNAILREIRQLGPEYIAGVEAEATPIEKMFGDGAFLEEDQDFEATEFVVKKDFVKDADGEIIGYAYTATGLSEEDIPGHNQPEPITILVAIDTTGKVKGVVTVEIEHTPGFYARHEEALDALKDIDPEDLEVVSEGSGATISGDLINKLFNAIKEAIIQDNKTPYEKMFGEVTVEVDDTFEATELVVKKEIVKDAEGNVVGYAYTATGLSDKEIPGHGQAESITLLVGIDTTGKVKGVITLESNHTPGFYAKYNDAIAALKDIDLDDLEIDLDASASISHRLLERLLNAVKEVGGQ